MCVISVGEDRQTVLKFRDDRGYTFPIGLDPRHREFRNYALDSIPRTYLIDRENRIVSQMSGFAPEAFDRLQEELQRRLN